MRRIAFVLVLLAGCMPGKDKADTTAQLSTDTVKPVTAADSAALARVDTAAKTTPAKTSATPTKTKTRTTSTSTATKTIGRDSVIRFDMGAKGRQMGKVLPPDSGKKPPE